MSLVRAVIFGFDEFEFDAERQELRRAGKPTKADGLLLRLLEVFVRNPGQLITKQELFSRVWDGRAVSENSLTVGMARLRKTLKHERGVRDVLLTVHGRGYRFLPTVVARERQASSLIVDGGPAAVGGTPFVGRERVMSQLRSALLDASSKSGCGSAIILTGEAGIGKTRVAEMLAREAAAANFTVAWTYCRELSDTPPLWPFAGLLREAILRPSRETIARDPRFVALCSELARLLPELASSAPSPAARDREGTERRQKLASKHRVFDAITRALLLAAEHKPCLLILDDLHRADAASLELLNYILAELPRARILLLATMRGDAESLAEAQLAPVLAHRSCARTALQALSAADVEGYVVALFGDVDKALSRAVFEKSEGNPLFMTELARQLRESDRLDIATLTTPSVALDWVRQRVAGMDDAARGALTCAAAIGRSFGLSLLQSILGRDAADVMSSLDEAIARGVIVPALDSSTEFVFAHELLRAALYEALDPAQRRGWHVRVAQALEQRVVLGEVPAIDLAYHAWTALPDGDLRKTVDHCIAASNAAARVYAYADAARYLQHARQALDLIEGGSVRLCFRLLSRQAFYVRAYSAKDFRPLAEQLLHLARELGTGIALAQVAMLLDSFPGFPQLPGSRAAMTEALESLPKDAQCLRAALRLRLASSAPLSQRAAVNRTQLEHAFELARKSPELGDRMTARFAELYLYGGPAHKARATTVLHELEDLGRGDAPAFALPRALLDVHRALTAAQNGDLRSMLVALERSAASCREYDLELLWHVERFQAFVLINTGRTDEGHAALLELRRRALSTDARLDSEMFCAYDQRVVLGGTELGSDPWPRILAADPDDPPNIRALKIRALAAAGAHDEARCALTAVPPEAFARLPCDLEYLGTLGAFARAAVALQAPDYARVLYELLSPFPDHFAVNFAFLCEGSVSQLLGMLARSTGEIRKARQHFDTAIPLSERAGFRTSAAEARLERDLCQSTASPN